MAILFLSLRGLLLYDSEPADERAYSAYEDALVVTEVVLRAGHRQTRRLRSVRMSV